MSIAQDVNLFSVRHGIVLVFHSGKGLVDVELVGVNLRTLFDVISNNWHDGIAVHVAYLTGFEFPIALNHSEDRRLTIRAAATRAMPSTTKVRLVYFDFASERVKVLGQNVADFLTHTPRGLIGNASLALDLLGRNSAASLHHEVDHIEPERKRSGGLVKNRIGSRGELITAMVAGVGFTPVHAMEQAICSALRAVDSLREFLVADVVKAGGIIREGLLEVFERVLGHGRFSGHALGSLWPRVIADYLLVVKGYTPFLL